MARKISRSPRSAGLAIDYFSNQPSRIDQNAIDEGGNAQQLTQATPLPDESAPAGVGVTRVRPEAGFGSDRSAPTGPSRDLAVDPLSPNEEMAAKGIANVVGSLPIPGSSIIGAAISGNLGYNGYNDTSLAGLTGRNMGLGYGPVKSASMALSGSMPGWMGLDDGLSAMDRNQIDRGALNPASQYDQMRAAGMTPQIDVRDLSTYSPAAQAQVEANAAFDRDWSAGMQGVNGGTAPAAPDTSHSSEASSGIGSVGDSQSMSPGGGYFADGGIVGLSAPRYADGGMMGEAPRSLAQMGFADGGQVGLTAPGGQPGAQDPMQMANQMARNPAIQQKVQQIVGPAMQSGELTPEELVTLGRIAEAAVHNPQLYPQLRQFAAQNGMTPLPPSYDPRAVTMLIVAAKVLGGGQAAPNGQPTPAGQVPPTDQAQMQNPTGMANGGMLRGPGTGRSDSIGTVNETTGAPVRVANGEYVIPAHVVKAKGQDFFDKMLRQYAQLTPQE